MLPTSVEAWGGCPENKNRFPFGGLSCQFGLLSRATAAQLKHLTGFKEISYSIKNTFCIRDDSHFPKIQLSHKSHKKTKMSVVIIHHA